jgi:hypothetical protein
VLILGANATNHFQTLPPGVQGYDPRLAHGLSIQKWYLGIVARILQRQMSVLFADQFKTLEL